MNSAQAPARDPAIDNAVDLFRELRDLRTDAPMPAAPLDRLVARLIDIGILAGVWIVIGSLLIALGALVFDWVAFDKSGSRYINIPDWGRASGLERIYIAVGGSLPFALAFLSELLLPSITGQTFGRRFTDLYLRDSRTDGHVRFPRILVRFVAGYVPAIVFFGLSGVFFATWLGFGCFILSLLSLAFIPGLAFLRDDHRGLHDVIARTAVFTPRHHSAAS